MLLLIWFLLVVVVVVLLSLLSALRDLRVPVPLAQVESDKLLAWYSTNTAKLPSVGLRLNASKSESMLAKQCCPPLPLLHDKH